MDALILSLFSGEHNESFSTIIPEMWVVAGDGEEIDKAAYGDGLQRCITADTKWSEVQVLAVVPIASDQHNLNIWHVLGGCAYRYF